MNLLQTVGSPFVSTGEGKPYSGASEKAGLMRQDGGETEEKTAPSSLGAHEDARALVQLIQCTQCSCPFRVPVTLPCGNTLCRTCLPSPFEREHISYPDLPGRRQAISCPFRSCGAEHPLSDCNIDVVLTKLMSSIAEVIAKHASVSESTAAQSELDTIWDEGISLPEKVALQEAVRGRLVTTYLLAAEGKLLRDQDVGYLPPAVTSDEERALDVDVLSDLLEATHREVDCQVCYNLMLDPVTTSCGHTLCRNCLARVLDHSQHCPVCRRGLAIPPSLHGQSSNKTLVQILNGLCSEAVSARAEAVALEETGGQGGLNVPLFVCTLGFPNQPTFLRIFEPRYRLMLRRCVEGNKEFGMLMYNRYLEPQGDLGPVHFYHYGIMLRIVHSQMLADGTSLIETRGIYRFRVKAHDVLDGYAVGSVERLEDVSLTEEERLEAIETSLPPVAEDDVAGRITRMSTQQLLAVGQDFIRRMQARSANWLQQRVLDIHGLPPDDAAMFPYWFASVLPISDEEKYKLMGTTTVRQRLKITASWIRRIESQRWYQSNSCRIL
ncbi:hypothetical protein BTJ68_03214 [Hortaea werneckii EXF-2000]|uniref:RING-type domain-containing protein n=2 Tax=Hortaea werneckii TaxID=91943 RepID=A0A1Z5TH70_HORWE|nr:hypothetical protein BTJ68_03214 [Hortaea werneckii EXF-2000]